MEQKTIAISGMHCRDCATKIETGVKALPGVQEAHLDFMAGTLSYRGSISSEEVESFVRKLGYQTAKNLQKPGRSSGIDFSGFGSYFLHLPDLPIVAIGLLLMGLTFFLPHLGISTSLLRWIRLAILPLAGWPVLRNGFISLFRQKKLDMDVLMSVAVIGAIIIGETSEAMILLALFTFSEALEGYTSDNARAILREFADLAPKTALKLVGGAEIETPVEDLQVGDVLLVRAGERVPMDGLVLKGHSEVNQAPITGESNPVNKEAGDDLLSGSINGMGLLQMQVTRPASESTIQRIIDMVAVAQGNKARQEKAIDRFATVYTPIVMVLAVLVAVVPPLFFAQPWWNEAGTYGWLHRALSLLMIGCPCALVISTPITIISGLSNGARNGVVFKGGIYLEALSQSRVIAFDKTGTLSTGKSVVSQVRAVDCTGEEPCPPCNDMVAIASALEVHSQHPLGNAVLQEARLRGVLHRYQASEDLHLLSGRGQQGTVNGKLATVGSLRLFIEEAHETPESTLQAVQEAQDQGQTTMLVSDGERVRGFLGVEDELRPEAPAVLSYLEKKGLRRVMLTGDNHQVAMKVAARLSLNEVHAALLPEQKLKLLEDLKASYGQIIMVGDGINDSPSLARADIGIAMGGANNAQVLESADVVLMDNKLVRLPFAFELSAQVNRLIRQNVAISLGVKIAVAVLALLGLTPLWVAVLGDIGVSLLVTINGLRALGLKPSDPEGADLQELEDQNCVCRYEDCCQHEHEACDRGQDQAGHSSCGCHDENHEDCCKHDHDAVPKNGCAHEDEHQGRRTKT